jgi:hypothetical protein
MGKKQTEYNPFSKRDISRWAKNDEPGGIGSLIVVVLIIAVVLKVIFFPE